MAESGYYILASNRICVGADFEDIRSGEYKAGKIYWYGVFSHDSGFNVLGPRADLNTLSGWVLET